MIPDNKVRNNLSFFAFLKRIFIFFMVCMTGFILLNAYHVMTYKQENKFVSLTEKSDHSNTLTGIYFTHHYKEQKVFSIQAKTASIKNKKIGFFRIGGLKQLELENMIVDYFEPNAKQPDFEQRDFSSTNESHDLLSYFSRASHSMQLLKNELAGFVAYHATIRYHHPDGILTIINSPYMEISKDRQSLQFRKNVAVHYQKEILLCKKLNYDVKHFRIVSNDKYTLIKNGVFHTGKGFRMNLRMQVIP